MAVSDLRVIISPSRTFFNEKTFCSPLMGSSFFRSGTRGFVVKRNPIIETLLTTPATATTRANGRVMMRNSLNVTSAMAMSVSLSRGCPWREK